MISEVFKNKNFLELYEPYIRHDWKTQYVAYDDLKDAYKAQKAAKEPNCEQLDLLILSEVKRVDFFLCAVLMDIERELKVLEQEESCDHSIELIVRQTYERCMDCEKFFDLNLFAIMKTIKKLNKLPCSSSVRPALAMTYVDDTFKQRFASAINLKSRCTELYTGKFCRNYPSLGNGELKFVKNKERVNPQSSFFLAFKFGISAAVFLLMTVDAYLGQDKSSQYWFWNSPGLYVYTCVGNLLVFRITWAINLLMWTRFGVNYIPIFQFPDNKPNMMIVLNHISTQMVLFSLNLYLYYESNKSTSVLVRLRLLKSSFPVILVVLYVIYEVWEYYLHGNSYRLSRGVFSVQSLQNCFLTPFVKVNFRDNYVANTLTSFTKVFADFFHACCWILCGVFIYSSDKQTVEEFGTSGLSCTGITMNIVIMSFQLLPQWMRFGQNLRQYIDTKQARYPWNMFKYSLTMLVILYGYFYDQYQVESIILVAAVALYKWWWDVVMNWGLFDSNTWNCSDSDCTTSSSNEQNILESARPWTLFGLRKQLMFPYASLYYVCIAGNLVLRFLWVMSLLPPSMTRTFVGPRLSFFLASMEIVRRAMWGLLKTEFEHIRYATARKPGYYFRRSIEFPAVSKTESPRSHMEDNDNIDDDEESHLEIECPAVVRTKPSSEKLLLDSPFLKIVVSQGEEKGENNYEMMMKSGYESDDSDSEGAVALESVHSPSSTARSAPENPKDK